MPAFLRESWNAVARSIARPHLRSSLGRTVENSSASFGSIGGGSHSRRVLGKPLDVIGHDSAFAEGVDEGDTIAAAVVAHEIAIRGDDRAQIVAEFEIDGGTVVERADAHVENMLRRFRRLAREPVREIDRDFAAGKDARPVGREPDQVGAPRLVDGEECREHGRDQNRAAGVRLGDRVIDASERRLRSRRQICATLHACPSPARTAAPIVRDGDRSRPASLALAGSAE